MPGSECWAHQVIMVGNCLEAAVTGRRNLAQLTARSTDCGKESPLSTFEFSIQTSGLRTKIQLSSPLKTFSGLKLSVECDRGKLM